MIFSLERDSRSLPRPAQGGRRSGSDKKNTGTSVHSYGLTTRYNERILSTSFQGPQDQTSARWRLLLLAVAVVVVVVVVVFVFVFCCCCCCFHTSTHARNIGSVVTPTGSQKNWSGRIPHHRKTCSQKIKIIRTQSDTKNNILETHRTPQKRGEKTSNPCTSCNLNSLIHNSMRVDEGRKG